MLATAAKTFFDELNTNKSITTDEVIDLMYHFNTDFLTKICKSVITAEDSNALYDGYVFNDHSIVLMRTYKNGKDSDIITFKNKDELFTEFNHLLKLPNSLFAINTAKQIIRTYINGIAVDAEVEKHYKDIIINTEYDTFSLYKIRVKSKNMVTTLNMFETNWKDGCIEALNKVKCIINI